MRGLRARVVVQTRGEDMRGSATTPAVSFFCGEGLAIVALDVTGLRFAVPEVVALEQGVESAEVLQCCLAVRELH
jgi:hypothetical protein